MLQNCAGTYTCLPLSSNLPDGCNCRGDKHIRQLVQLNFSGKPESVCCKAVHVPTYIVYSAQAYLTDMTVKQFNLRYLHVSLYLIRLSVQLNFTVKSECVCCATVQVCLLSSSLPEGCNCADKLVRYTLPCMAS